MLYRPYTPADFDRLYAIEVLCFEPLFRFDRWYMRQLVQRSHTAVWIAEDEAKMTGFAIVEWTRKNEQTTAYLQTIEVAPEARGQGIGRELLVRIEDSARTAGAALIWLHVEAANATAIRLYEAEGYCCEGRRENYYPLNRAALVYRKRIDSRESTEIPVTA